MIARDSSLLVVGAGAVGGVATALLRRTTIKLRYHSAISAILVLISSIVDYVILFINLEQILEG